MGYWPVARKLLWGRDQTTLYPQSPRYWCRRCRRRCYCWKYPSYHHWKPPKGEVKYVNIFQNILHIYLSGFLWLFRLVHLSILISHWLPVSFLFRHIHLCIVWFSHRTSLRLQPPSSSRWCTDIIIIELIGIVTAPIWNRSEWLQQRKGDVTLVLSIAWKFPSWGNTQKKTWTKFFYFFTFFLVCYFLEHGVNKKTLVLKKKKCNWKASVDLHQAFNLLFSTTKMKAFQKGND